MESEFVARELTRRVPTRRGVRPVEVVRPRRALRRLMARGRR